MKTKWTKIGKLEWSEDLGKMNWYDAVKKCEKKGGRLPTRIELVDLYDNHYEEMKKMLKSSPDNSYWSATTISSNTQYAWYANLTNGFTFIGNKTDTTPVRCVR